MTIFADFSDMEGKPVSINPHLVRAVKPGPDSNVCCVSFDNEHSISVRGTLEDVTQELLEAMRTVSRYRSDD